MAFLEVLTRTFGERPTMLLRNKLSLSEQTSKDWQQTLLVDEEKRGVPWAVGNLSTVEAEGEYVWILDDDDECIDPEFVEKLKEFVTAQNLPDVVIVRMEHTGHGTLPPLDLFGQAPELGKIGTSAFVVRRDVWNANRFRWVENYTGDYFFIAAVYRKGYRFVWWDMVASRTQTGHNAGARE
jgi:glycosyltransferase involved in cell wall biosynthesis